MQLDIPTAAVLFILGAVTWKVVGWSVDRFLKKTAGADYVTRQEFDDHKSHCVNLGLTERKELLETIRKLEAKIDQQSKEQMRLRMMMIKHYMLNNVPEDTAQFTELQGALDELERSLNA